MYQIIDRLEKDRYAEKDELIALLNCDSEEVRSYLFERARRVREGVYGNEVYIRGLIEFTNICKNDCYYCGIRKSNPNANRYRLSKEEILSCCKNGYELGFRTFVLQGGEDGYFSDAVLEDIIKEIKRNYPDCAITLSVGERSRDSYQRLFDAGADRYLLRHETANCGHYHMLHPESMSYENRMQCLKDLKEIGYQVGAGFMVGSPYQKTEYLVEDLLFLKELNPHMIGIGPFIPHQQTEFANQKQGSLTLTLTLLAILRLMFPNVLLPATTALGTIAPNGRELGLLAGANVVMPNLSPVSVRKKYELYDNKICTGDEAAECIQCLTRRVGSVGYHIVTDRGDYKAE